MARAQGMQENNWPQYLSFSKQLQKSHLSDKFYLGLPKKFCDAHLPYDNHAIILVDESEHEYETMYWAKKNRLRCGWRGFATAHNLLEGDTLVFHMIEPCKFKVHIVARASRFAENDLQNNNPPNFVKKEDLIEENTCSGNTETQKHPLSHQTDNLHVEKKARLVHVVKPINIVYNFDSNIQEGIANSEPVFYFEDMKGLEDFRIQVNDTILDSEIPAHIKTKYYELCVSQKTFLHNHLINGLSMKLAVVIISETVEIADGIREASIGTPIYQKLECWDKTLKSFGDLGMEVEFLRARVHRLISLSQESQVSVESTRMKNAQVYEQRRDLHEKSVKLDALLENVMVLKASVENLENEVGTLTEKNEELDFVFKEIANSPW